MTSIIESGPSTKARLLTSATRLTVRHALRIACQGPTPHLPWPYGVIEFAARAVPVPAHREILRLPNATAELIRAPGVSDRTGRIILYFHGGAFLFCGTSTHLGLIARLSRYSDAPVLSVNYRMIPAFSVADAVQDGIDAYYHLREEYEPWQIVLAGDSAGGYLAMAVANYLIFEPPAAMALISPLLQLDPGPRKAHPNMRCDAMFSAAAFDTLAALVARANGGYLYEPLDDIDVLPPTLIHVSGHEALLHDARLAAERCGAEVHVWPGQIHVFQIAPFIPEANRSLEHIGRYVIAQTSNNIHSDRNDLTYRTGTVG